MKWLERLFKRKKKTYLNEKGKYKLLIIDDEAELLHRNLGIRDVRADEIMKACIDAFEKNSRVHLALESAINECVHTNEVVFASLMMAKIIEKNEYGNRLHNMLKNMFGNG
jgi:hypothetical protein